MEVQVRDYRILPGRLDEFVAAWEEVVLPLRRAAGFTVVGAWPIPEEERFLWVVAWDGPGTFADADAAYYASPDRTTLEPNPARLIAHSSHFMVTPKA